MGAFGMHEQKDRNSLYVGKWVVIRWGPAQTESGFLGRAEDGYGYLNPYVSVIYNEDSKKPCHRELCMDDAGLSIPLAGTVIIPTTKQNLERFLLADAEQTQKNFEKSQRESETAAKEPAK